VSGTGDDVEELWQGVDEVDNLGEEEEQHGLAEVPQNAHHRKGHPRKVAEGVPHKHRGGVPARQDRVFFTHGSGSGVGDLFGGKNSLCGTLNNNNKPVMVEKPQRGEEER